MKIIMGDLENALAINTLIIITKNVIFTAMKKEQKTPLLFQEWLTRFLPIYDWGSPVTVTQATVVRDLQLKDSRLGEYHVNHWN